nr:hypothetical protein [Synechococcus sp. CS-1329]
MSTVLVVGTAGLIRFDHPIGRMLFFTASTISLYWGYCYGRLEH